MLLFWKPNGIIFIAIENNLFSQQSTLLSTLTSTKSECAAYEFTTLTCIPGVIEVNYIPGVINVN